MVANQGEVGVEGGVTGLVVERKNRMPIRTDTNITETVVAEPALMMVRYPPPTFSTGSIARE